MYPNEKVVKNLNISSRLPAWGDDDPSATSASPMLPPAEPLGERFLRWFHHPWRFLHADAPDWGKRPDWKFEQAYYLEPRNLWREYRNRTCLLGLGFGRLTGYVMLDVDAGSPWHPHNDQSAFKHLLGVLETIGLCRVVVVRSSASGGLHVYYFLAAPVSTWSLACAVENALWDAGIVLAPGELESFPNAKSWGSYYHPHRLPLQEGSYLLDADWEPCTDDLEAFLDAAERAADGQDHGALQAALRHAKKPRRRRLVRQSTTLGDRHAGCRADLEAAIAEGWTGHGQTNQLLRLIAKYAHMWLGLQGHALVQSMVEIARSCPGYETWCRHQHEIEKRCREWARWAERQHSPYASHPQRQGSYRASMAAVERQEGNNIVAFHQPNAERQRQALSRLQHCVALLQEAEALPQLASERSRALIIKSKEIYDGVGFSQSTLHKLPYLALWHPDYLASQVDDGSLLDPWDEGMPEACVNPVPEPLYTQFAMEVVGQPILFLPPAADGHPSSALQLEVEPLDSSITTAYPCFFERNAPLGHQQTLSMEQVSLLPSLDSPQSPVPECAASPLGCDPVSQPPAPAENPPVGDDGALLSNDELAARRQSLVEHQGSFLYRGPSAHTLVRLTGQKRMVVRGVHLGQEVVICTEAWTLHPQLLYVKPLRGADDWLDGVQVRWDCLHPQPPPLSVE